MRFSEILVLLQTAVLRGRLPKVSCVTLEEVRERVALQNRDNSRKLHRSKGSKGGKPARLPNVLSASSDMS